MKLENQKLIRFGVQNKNGRIYQESEFTRIREYSPKHNDRPSEETSHTEASLIERLNGQLFRKYNDSGRRVPVMRKIPVLGELGHPEQFDVNLKNVSHRLENFRIEGEYLICDVHILETENGKLLKNIILDAIDVGAKDVSEYIVFRSRGAGTVDEDGYVTIETLHTFDAIPSNIDSYAGLMN